MKLNFCILFSSLIFLFCNAGYSQKALEKEWAKKLKELKPMDYKALIEERDNLQKEVADCSSSKATMRAESDNKAAEVERIQAELELTKKALDSAKASGGGGSAVVNSDGLKQGAKTVVKGVVYKVQIGSFKNKDLSKYFENNKNFTGEVDEDGTKKYSLGIFTDYWEADKFKKYLRDMGVKDAWIVSYKDGKRVNIKDALEGTL